MSCISNLLSVSECNRCFRNSVERFPLPFMCPHSLLLAGNGILPLLSVVGWARCSTVACSQGHVLRDWPSCQLPLLWVPGARHSGSKAGGGDRLWLQWGGVSPCYMQLIRSLVMNTQQTEFLMSIYMYNQPKSTGHRYAAV